MEPFCLKLQNPHLCFPDLQLRPPSFPLHIQTPILKLMGTIIFIIVIIYLYSKISKLESQIRQIQQQLSGSQLPPLKPSLKTEKVTAPIETHVAIADISPPSEPVSEPSESPAVDRLLHWLAIDWPLKAGAFLIILGFGWLVTYAFLNNWIGPTGRVTFGLLAGACIMSWGHFHIRRSHHQGLILSLLGASITLVTIFAAQQYYALFPTTVALILNVAVMLFISYSSLTYHDRWLATTGLVIGGLAPILTGSTEPNIFGLYSYLFALCIGVLWLTRYTQWRFLTPLSLIIIIIYSLPYIFSDYRSLQSQLTPTELLQLRFFAVSFTSLFFFSSTTSLIHSKNQQDPNILTALGIGAFALGWINSLVPAHFQSLVASLTAVSFTFATYTLFKITTIPTPVYIYTAVSLLHITAAAVFQFDRPQLTIALSFIAAAAPLLGLKYFNQQIGFKLLLYFLLPVLISTSSLLESWPYGLLHDHALASYAITTALWTVGLYLYQHKQQVESQENSSSITNIFIITAAIYTLFILGKLLHANLLIEYQARMLTLFIYAAIGMGTYLYGQMHHRHVLHRFGQLLTLFVIGWLLLIEVWDMPLAGRIITFFAIGTLLIASILLRPHKQPPLNTSTELNPNKS